jgi:hypothetical protein
LGAGLAKLHETSSLADIFTWPAAAGDNPRRQYTFYDGPTD